jgi:hypothetical protein
MNALLFLRLSSVPKKSGGIGEARRDYMNESSYLPHLTWDPTRDCVWVFGNDSGKILGDRFALGDYTCGEATMCKHVA